MVDLVITPANVIAGANAQRTKGTSGVAILAGQWIVKDATVNKFVLADNNATDVKLRKPDGVALHGSSPGQPIELQTSGDITIGGTMVAGTDYFLSGAAGAMCPRADVVSGMNVALLGLSKTTTVFVIDIQAPGVTL
jgi:hypothetical protein